LIYNRGLLQPGFESLWGRQLSKGPILK